MAQPYNPEEPLISIHVPRTGGTSVRVCLQEWFGPNFYSHYPDEASNGAPILRRLGPRSCVHGHFNKHRGFGVCQYYPNHRQWITFLRDPFERHVSVFFYLRKHETQYHFAGRPVPASAWKDFEEFLAFIADNRDRVQTTFANTLLAHLPIDEYDDVDKSLSRFIHVGITEQLAASLQLLAHKLHFGEAALPHVNAAERTIAVAPRLREKHEALFPIEHAVYRAARANHAAEIENFEATRAARSAQRSDETRI